MVRGTLITFAFQAVALLLGFATRSILAALLHKEGLGLFEFFRFIPTFLHAATNLGLNNSLINFIGKKKYSIPGMSALSLQGGLWLSITSLLATGVIFLAVRFLFWGKDLVPISNWAAILGLLLYVPYMLWFLNVSFHLGRGKMFAYNFIWILPPVCSFIGYLLIYLILPENVGANLKLACVYIVYSVGFLISLGAGLIILTREKMISWAIPAGAIKDSVRFGIKTHIGSLVGFLSLRINIPLLFYLLDEASVGVYSIAMTFGEAFKRLFSSISTALLPVASSADGERAKSLINKVLRVTIFICIITLLLFAFVCQWLIFLLFDKVEFAGAVQPTLFLLLWVLFSTVNKVFQSDAIGRGHPVWVTYSSVTTFITLIASVWFLVPEYKIMGAVYASTLSAIAGTLLWVILYSFKAEGFNLLKAIFISLDDVREILKRVRESMKNPAG